MKLAVLIEEYHNATKLQVKKRCSRLRKLSSQSQFCLPRYNNIYGARKHSYLLPKIINQLPEHVQKLYVKGGKIRKLMKMHFLKCNNLTYIL
jgi:nucleoside-diphosphate-sugar epimerase